MHLPIISCFLCFTIYFYCFLFISTKSINLIFANAQTVQINNISAGMGFNCVCFNNGNIKCFGAGAFSRLGLGDELSRGDEANEMGTALPYLNLGSGLTAVSVHAGAFHACARFSTNTAKCWGYNIYGQVGTGVADRYGDSTTDMGNNLPFVSIGTGRTILQIVTGYLHTCVLLDNSSVKCFGNGENGRLGYGNTNNRGNAANQMGNNLPIVNLGSFVTSKLVIGSYAAFSCAISTTNKMKCWGSNTYGQLGYGDTNDRGDVASEMGTSLLEIDLGVGRTVKTAAASAYNTCAILDNDQTKCWGRNNYGQLAIGSTNNIGDGSNEMGSNLVSSNLGTSRYATKVSIGEFSICFVLDNNKLKCFGRNTEGQLGQGNTITFGATSTTIGDLVPPIDLGTSLTITDVQNGQLHVCVLFNSIKVKCFGDNASLGGTLGYGDTNNRGDQATEMGTNLKFVQFFSTLAPTKNPTTNPTTRSPTSVPTTRSPSLSPTNDPTTTPTTWIPTLNPTLSPSQSPTIKPTHLPSMNPTTRSPTTHAPSSNPTVLPSSSPTRQCDYQSAKICKYDYNCMWRNNNGIKSCVIFDCIALNQNKCAKQRTRCKWNKKLLICDAKTK